MSRGIYFYSSKLIWIGFIIFKYCIFVGNVGRINDNHVFDMVKIKKKESSIAAESIRGHQLRLKLEKRETCLRISIHNVSSDLINVKLGIALLVTFINIICLIFDILPVKASIAIFCLLLLTFYRIWGIVREEKLLIVPSLGIQIIIRFAIGSKTVFIPQEQINKVFLNEVIFRHKVIYVLNLLIYEMKTKEDLVEQIVPIFTGTLPRLACLRIIYNHIVQMQINH